MTRWWWNLLGPGACGLCVVFEIVDVSLGEHVTRPIAITWLSILLAWIGIAAVYKNLWDKRGPS
jgi:hypothetical protein